MREIKFRAKATEDYKTNIEDIRKGDWVYGYYYFCRERMSGIIVTTLGKESGGVGSGIVQVEIKVDYKTVGQYVDCNNKNGKEIYEGDILEFDGYPCVDIADGCDLNSGEFTPSGKGVNYRYVVEWFDEDACWYAAIEVVSDRVAGHSCGMMLGEFVELKNVHIVGNIYENPELLNKL